MSFFIPMWAFRCIAVAITMLCGVLMLWKVWPRPEDAKGWERWMYMLALFSLFVRVILWTIFDIFELFPLP